MIFTYELPYALNYKLFYYWYRYIEKYLIWCTLCFVSSADNDEYDYESGVKSEFPFIQVEIWYLWFLTDGIASYAWAWIMIRIEMKCLASLYFY